MARKKKSNKTLYIALGIIVLAIVGALVAKSTGLIGKPNEIEVEYAKAKRSTIVEKVSASGMIQPEKEVKISPDVPGEITELHVAEGDSVQQGQLLIKIRPDNYQVALSRSQANLNQQKANFTESQARMTRAEAQFNRAKLQYERQKGLYEEKVISTADFEQAEVDFKVAEQDLVSAKQTVEAARYSSQSAEASVSEAQTNLTLTSVYAPVTGTVSKLLVEQGERVVGTSQMAGTEMLRVADLNLMEVRVDVNENDIIRISIGDTAIIDVDSYAHTSKKFKGVVTAIANTAKEKTTADAVTEFEVKVRVLNSSYADLLKEKQRSPFRPGMTASVDIITQRKEQVLSVPLSAVTTRSEADKRNDEEGDDDEEAPSREAAPEDDRLAQAEMREVVFIEEDGKAKMVYVTTGISDFDNIEILSGLEEGANVISGPFVAISKRLNDGDAITTENKPEDQKIAGKAKK